MAEVWKTIVGFPAYKVSSLGRIRRIVEGKNGAMPKVLKPWITREGYAIVSLSGDGGIKRMQVSRLVCLAFHGPPPSRFHQAAHGDGNPANNRKKNLRWATRAENMADCLIHGTRAIGIRHGRSTKPEKTPRGSAHGHAKLTEKDVLAIRQTPKTLGSGVRLAAQYGVSTGAICLIRARKNWKHI